MSLWCDLPEHQRLVTRKVKWRRIHQGQSWFASKDIQSGHSRQAGEKERWRSLRHRCPDSEWWLISETCFSLVRYGPAMIRSDLSVQHFEREMMFGRSDGSIRATSVQSDQVMRRCRGEGIRHYWLTVNTCTRHRWWSSKPSEMWKRRHHRKPIMFGMWIDTSTFFDSPCAHSITNRGRRMEKGEESSCCLCDSCLDIEENSPPSRGSFLFCSLVAEDRYRGIQTLLVYSSQIEDDIWFRSDR